VAVTNAPHTAFDVKPVHRRLEGLRDDELKQIPVLPEGTHLQEGSTYIDLAESLAQEFKATGGMVAGPSHWYVSKRDVPFELWNRLIGVTNPQRTHKADR